MGVSIELYVLPGGIERAAWERAYEEVRRFWSAHPSGPRRAAWRSVSGVEVPMFVRDLEYEERGRRACAIAGDRASLRFGEPCALPSWGALPGRGGGASGDVLFGAGRVRLLGGRTRGAPYGALVLAAGMIVESLLPGHAFVAGGFGRLQAERARAEIERCVGLAVALPVVVDAEALCRRVGARREGPAFVRSFARRYVGPRAAGLGHALRAVDGEAAGAWLRAALRGGGGGGVAARVALGGWLRAGRPIGDFVRIALEAGFDPPALADAIARSGALLSPRLGERVRGALGRAAGEGVEAGGLALAMARFSLERLELDVGVDEGELEAAFVEGAPGLARSLLGRARAEASGLVGDVEDALALLDDAGRCAPPAPRPAEGELHRVASFDEAGPAGRAAIARFVDAVYDAWNPPRPDAACDELSSCVAGLRRAFAAAMAQCHPVLTEDAWEAISAERDVGVWRWLVRLARCEGPGDALGLKRALLEGAALRREGARLYAEREAQPSRRLIARGPEANAAGA